MANRYTRSNSITVELTADSLDQRDKEVMQALVTAGALASSAFPWSAESRRARRIVEFYRSTRQPLKLKPLVMMTLPSARPPRALRIL